MRSNWYQKVLRVGKLAGAMTAVLTLLGVVLTAMVVTVGWLALQAGLHPILVVVVLLDLVAVLVALIFLGLIYREVRKPYRAALGKVVRDYYAEKSRLEYELDPKGRALPSARLHSGHADPDWAGPIYDWYGIPREERYGG